MNIFIRNPVNGFKEGIESINYTWGAANVTKGIENNVDCNVSYNYMLIISVRFCGATSQLVKSLVKYTWK